MNKRRTNNTMNKRKRQTYNEQKKDKHTMNKRKRQTYNEQKKKDKQSLTK
jgi:hypothetical protein